MELRVIYEHEEMRDMVVHVNSEGLQKIMTILADENNIIVTQLTQRVPDAANTWCKDNDTITDDFGSTISAWCPNGCGKTMQVVRPGKFQCSECY